MRGSTFTNTPNESMLSFTCYLTNATHLFDLIQLGCQNHLAPAVVERVVVVELFRETKQTIVALVLALE